MSDSRELSAFAIQGLSAEQARFCELLADRMEVGEAVATMGWKTHQYRAMRAQLPAFDSAVTLAREMAQDGWVDKMQEIAETTPDVNRARLLVDAIKWRASKIKPRTYGDKLDITLDARIDIGDALATARARAALRPMCDPADIIDGQVIDSQTDDVPSPSDKQSTLPGFPDIFS